MSAHLDDLLLTRLLDLHDEGPNFYTSFYRRHVCEIILECLFSLNPAVSDFANLIAIELFPFLVIKPLKKVEYVYRIDEVDEGIAHIAAVLEVNWQVEEVVLAL